MDILSIKPQTIQVELMDPATNEPLGIVVECQSYISDGVKTVQRAIQNKELRSGRNSQTAEKIENNTNAIMAAAIVGWKWNPKLTLGDLKDPPCTNENKLKLISAPWAFQQLDARISDEAAFFKKSATA
jgi:hypothetical protein